MKDVLLDSENYEFSFDHRGFYHVYIKEGEEFSMDDYMKIHLHLASLDDAVMGPFLVEFGYGCSFSEGVKEITATSVKRKSTADALLIQSYAHNLVAEFFLKHHNPIRPVAKFYSKDEAIAWMLQFVEEEEEKIDYFKTSLKSK